MANYSQLTANQQTSIDTLITMLSPAVGQFSRDLTMFNAVDTQYLSLASAALGILTASEYTFANFAATAANTNAPVVTSASHNFTADEVGNLFNVTAGTNWTVGLYRIASVAANAATLDRACASVASPTSGTANVLAMVPNKVDLAGSQLTISRADIVSMISHLESALASFNDSNHRQLWVKACGPSNL
jgi:hypothetical protein